MLNDIPFDISFVTAIVAVAASASDAAAHVRTDFNSTPCLPLVNEDSCA